MLSQWGKTVNEVIDREVKDMMREMGLFPETKTERKKRLRPFLHLSTCPTSNGKDLEVWEELKGEQHG